MAEFYLNLPIQYFPDPANGRPVSNGNVYIGIPDLDPEIEANRVPVVIIEEDGTRVVIAPSAQPLLTSPGGVITYQGSYVSVLIDGSYSIKVNDSTGAQAYYVANVQGTIQPPLNDYNLVANGSFEIDTNNDGSPDDWGINVIGAVAIDATDRISGTQSLQFLSSGSGAGDATTENFFEVSELRGINVSFSLISSVVDIRNLVQVIWYDSNMLQLLTTPVYDNELTNSLVWEDHITTVTVPALATFAKLQIFGAHPSNTNLGSAWFDSVRITELTPEISNQYDETGVANAYVLKVKTNKQSPVSLVDGQEFNFTASSTSTSASTLSLISLGVKSIADTSVAGAIIAGTRYKAIYDSLADNVFIKRNVAPFRGALITGISPNQTIPDDIATLIRFSGTEYDTDNMFTVGTSDTDIVVPAGVTKIVLSVGVEFLSGIKSGFVLIETRHNGALALSGLPYLRVQAVNETSSLSDYLSVTSAVLNVTGGDTISSSVRQNSGGSRDLSTGRVYMGVQIIE